MIPTCDKVMSEFCVPVRGQYRRPCPLMAAMTHASSRAPAFPITDATTCPSWSRSASAIAAGGVHPFASPSCPSPTTTQRRPGAEAGGALDEADGVEGRSMKCEADKAMAAGAVEASVDDMNAAFARSERA